MRHKGIVNNKCKNILKYKNRSLNVEDILQRKKIIQG